MYNNLKNNIQTGNDRINRLKSKILSREYKKKYKDNRVNYNTKNSSDTCSGEKFRKLPYIQNNSDKLLISRGFFDCSRNYTFDKQVLDSYNNYYSLKTSNNYLIYNSGSNKTDNDLSFNTLNYNDIYENKDFFIANTHSQKTQKQQLKELNNFSHKYHNECGYKVYKQSSVKIYNLINQGRNINAEDENTNRDCGFLDPQINT